MPARESPFIDADKRKSYAVQIVAAGCIEKFGRDGQAVPEVLITCLVHLSFRLAELAGFKPAG